jgi:hypothetical protein
VYFRIDGRVNGFAPKRVDNVGAEDVAKSLIRGRATIASR